MENPVNKGVILDLSHPGSNGSLDYQEIITTIRNNSNVSAIWTIENPASAIVNKISKAIIKHPVDQLIIAGDMTGLLKDTFKEAMIEAGRKCDDIVLLSFRKFGLTRASDTPLATALLKGAIAGLAPETAILTPQKELIQDTLVIGGGIAGIQAALEIADGQIRVTLVEKTGTIGGKMATFDKTFPTLDCAACILTPKMVEVNQHPMIDLLTYSEIQAIHGEPGNYKVTILKKARRVNLATCIGCGTCSEKCPAKAPSEFDAGTTLRKAIYIPFPQAVPNKYLVDEKSCIYLKNGKCKACVKACPVPDCINLDEQDETVEIKVGNIVVATGFKPFDAKKMPQFGYGKFPNVVTALEFERLLNASGSTGGTIRDRVQDKKGNWIFTQDANEPRKLAIIHCIGSRDEHYNKYCSRVCCMYSLKFAHLIREKIPDAEIHEFYIDMRAFGKGYEAFYERIKKEDIHMIRGKTAKVEQVGDRLHLRGENMEADELIETDVDMVVLATGLEPAEETERMAEILGIQLSPGGWFKSMNCDTDPTGTHAGGIYIAGVCQGPKDIPDSVAQGSSAASRVTQNILRGKVAEGFNSLTPEAIEVKIQEQPTIS